MSILHSVAPFFAATARRLRRLAGGGRGVDADREARSGRSTRTSRGESIANIDENAAGTAAAEQSASDVDDAAAESPADQGGEA